MKLLPLSFRREIIDLTFFLKCKLELCDLNLYNFVVFNSTLQNRPTTGSSADALLLILKRCKTIPQIFVLTQIMFTLGWHVVSVLTVGRCTVFCFLFLFCSVLFFSLMGGPLNDILVIGGTVLEVLAPVSPCHSLVQKFMASVCNIFWCLVNLPYFDVYFDYGQVFFFFFFFF